MTLTCDDLHMASPRHAGMYVESPSRTYQAKDGSTRTYRTHLLRRSFREDGKVKKETLANVSALPDSVIAALKASLSGSVLVDAGDVLEIERSLPHGHVAAAHVRALEAGAEKPARPRLFRAGPGVRADNRPRGCAGVETGHHPLVGQCHVEQRDRRLWA